MIILAYPTSGLPCWTCPADVEPSPQVLTQVGAGSRNRVAGGVWGA